MFPPTTSCLYPKSKGINRRGHQVPSQAQFGTQSHPPWVCWSRPSTFPSPEEKEGSLPDLELPECVARLLIFLILLMEKHLFPSPSPELLLFGGGAGRRGEFTSCSLCQVFSVVA